jgi:hypothetical protein
MKQLIILITIVLLAACSKPNIVLENKTLYYRIQQADLDGTVTYTPIRKIKTESVANATTDEDEDDDDDEDGDCDGHYTLAIDFTTFTVSNVKNGIQVNWEADNEQNVSHYIIERSNDTKNWITKLNYIPDHSGKYTILDTF